MDHLESQLAAADVTLSDGGPHEAARWRGLARAASPRPTATLNA
jgi:hypothetical protein